MAKIFASQHLVSDFASFKVDLFNTNQILYSLDDIDASTFKKGHQTLYGLALLNGKLIKQFKNESHKHLYPSEIVSDALIWHSLMTQGFVSSCNILHRRIIENFYNHIFYFDHPIEFDLLEEGKNEYVPIKSMRDYVADHPVLKTKNHPVIKDFNSEIFNVFQEHSKVVHSKGIVSMNLAANLSEIKKDDADVDVMVKGLIKTLASILYIFFKFHRDLKFTHPERDVISGVYTKNLRSGLLE